jgi:hypothetical protein
MAATGGMLLGLGDVAFLSKLPPVSAAETQLGSSVVQMEPDIEPLVELLEKTPRDRLLEEVASRIRHGLSYREVLAALLLAGVRNVQPRPGVGFKFHAVLAVNSVHLASLSAPDGERWLPIFWALDYFKEAQARDQSEGDWRMKPVDERAVPPASKAREAFVRAMDAWDEAAADVAVAALARTASANEIFELLYRYGARDFRSIGHKAIFVSNTQRVLPLIGWRYAEPVLRSLAYALLMHEGDNPSGRDAPSDRPWRQNQARLAQIPAAWQGGTPSGAKTIELLAVLRQSTSDAACDKLVELLKGGIAPQSIWDALFCGAAELLLRQPGIVALHALTTTNALHFAYQTSGDDATRRLLMLQNAAFLPMFRAAIEGRGKLTELAIDRLQPQASANSGPKAVAEIFTELSGDRMTAVKKALAHLQAAGSPQDLMDTARRLILVKADEPHDYKLSVAVLEDYFAVSPAWRDRYLAASLLRLRSPADHDNKLVERIRAALQG